MTKNAFWGLSHQTCNVIAGSTRNRRVSAYEGFTLAEALITLGIIGIVAAMTMPALIEKHNKTVVGTRLAKFYSNINQAVRLAEVEYGDKKIWWEDLTGAQFDEDGNPIEGTSKSEQWFNKFLAPHLNIIKRKTLSNGTFIVYFSDGSALKPSLATESRDWQFFPSNPDKCLDKYSHNMRQANGKCAFPFILAPSQKTFLYHYDKGFEPYKYDWNGDVQILYTDTTYGCKSSNTHLYCTAIIQLNGWKVPDDYPIKF